MNWNNVKTLLIVLLTVVNLFFGGLLAVQTFSTGYLKEESVENAVSLLEKSGIRVGENAIPKKKNQNRFALGRFRDNYYEQAVSAITGNEESTVRTTVNGMIVQMSESGAVFEFIEPFGFFYEDGSESASTVKAVFSDDDFFLPFDESKDTDFSLSKRQLTAMERFLLCTSESDGYTFTVTGLYRDSVNNFLYAKANQCRSMAPIGGMEGICVFQEDELIYAEGNWIFCGIDETYTVDLYDQIDALFFEKQYREEKRVKSDDKNAIVSVESLYSLFWNNQKTEFYLVPSWSIVCQNGEARTYNAVNGNLYTS